MELKFLAFLAMILFVLPGGDKVTFQRGEFQNTGRTTDPADIGSCDPVFGQVPDQSERGIRHRVPGNDCRGRIICWRSAGGGRFDFFAGQSA